MEYTHDRDCSCLGCCRKAAVEAAQFLEECHAKPASLADQIMAVEYATGGMPRGLYWAARTLRWVEQHQDKIKRTMKQEEKQHGK